jgi:zinc transport system substrate-binding protein
MVLMKRPRALALPALGATAATALLLAGCGAAATGTGGTGGSAKPSVQVLASFYPLQYVAQQVGGGLVQVSSLTPPGAEPHDVELSPRQVRAVSETDVVVYLSGFQSAVDEAIAAREPAHVVDAADTADLVKSRTAGDGGALDPHFWLDPTRLARLAAPVAAQLAKADPAHADTYRANASALEIHLADLDTEYKAGLATCKRHTIVTSHEAFAYLASRYDLKMVGISGLNPDAEPSPARLKEIGDAVKAEGVTTLFSEQLVNPKVAQTLATDLGVTSAVLDPLESQADPASDYRGVMEKNLTRLREALGCE